MEKFKNSVSFKILTIFFLVIILLIPLGMVKGLIKERQNRKSDVIREISSKWGNEQTIAGPVITVPYKKWYKNKEGKKRYSVKYAHFLPEKLNISGKIYPEIRYRGIYEAVVYNAQLELTGKFADLDFKELGISKNNVIWSAVYISLGISDMRGIKKQINAKIGKSTVPMNPGMESNDVLASGISAKIPMLKKTGNVSFNFPVNLNGSERLSFEPMGKTTNVELSSEWPDPSFDGAFLPAERDVKEDGFSAKWKVLHINRSYPQQWKGNKYKISGTSPDTKAPYYEMNSDENLSSFGVKLFTPLDVYRKSTRSAKYAAMFIMFTFTAFFFSEIMNRLRIHPIQYLLVGFAVIVFYSLLISISEHLNFGNAYLISSVAVISLITVYSKSILRSKYHAIMVCGVLTLLYGYFYIVLQLEDFALLLGSGGLFSVLTAVMYLTRKIDWYAIKLDD